MDDEAVFPSRFSLFCAEMYHKVAPSVCFLFEIKTILIRACADDSSYGEDRAKIYSTVFFGCDSESLQKSSARGPA